MMSGAFFSRGHRVAVAASRSQIAVATRQSSKKFV
jgi:hypothetical protein